MMRLGNIRLKVPDRSQISHKCYPALLACIWCYPPLSGYIAKIFSAIPLVGQFADTFYPAIIVALILLSAGHLVRQIRPADVVFGGLAIMTVFLTAMFMPQNAEYIEEQLVQMLLISLPVYYVGLALDYEESKKVLYWASVLSVVFSLIYRLNMLLNGQILMLNSMSASYKVLPSVMYLLLWSVRQGGVFNWILALLGCVLTLLCGTRGPMVVIVVYVAIEQIIKIAQMENSWKKLARTTVYVMVILLLMIDDAWLKLLEAIARMLGEMGVGNRILYYLINGEFSVSNGRNLLAEQVIQAIGENPILGYGVMGDRTIIEGRYVHNIFWEFLCHYGVFLGTALLAMVFALPILAISRSRGKDRFHFLLMLVCMVFIKLLVSSSYLLEPHFFLLLGVSARVIREKRTLE